MTGVEVVVESGCPILAASSRRVSLLGCSEEEVRELMPYDPDRFPGGEFAPAVVLWPGLSLWLDDAGRARRVQVRPAIPVAVEGVDVFTGTYRSVCARLSSFPGETIVGGRSCTLPWCGVRIYSGDGYIFKHVTCVEFSHPGEASLRAEELRPLAKKMLGGAGELVRLACSWVSDLPYSIVEPPRSALHYVQAELDNQEWSEALGTFVYAISERGIRPGEELKLFVESLAAELCPDVKLSWP